MVKNLPGLQEPGFHLWVGKIPWRGKWRSTPVFWPGEFHGEKSPSGYSPWGCKELDMTEQLSFHFTSLALETVILRSLCDFKVKNSKKKNKS